MGQVTLGLCFCLSAMLRRPIIYVLILNPSILSKKKKSAFHTTEPLNESQLFLVILF